MQIKREFAPTTLKFQTEAELNEFTDILYAAYHHLKCRLYSNDRDKKAQKYIMELINKLRS